MKASGSGDTHVVTVGADGSFAFSLKPGKYTLVGKSPMYSGPGCMTGQVTVVSDKEVTADVVCVVP
jgi:hypothetical protein